MKKLFFFILLVSAPWAGSAQVSLNMNLLGNWHDPTLLLYIDQIYSDIWGYAAGGREYAILTSSKDIHFLDITNPASVVEVARFAGGEQTFWRDVKTYGQYAYAVSDQTSEGLMVFDLSDLPNSVTLVQQSTAYFTRAHNIFVEESSGRLYVLGPNVGHIFVLDLTNDPANPGLLTNINLPGGYVHDIFASGNQVWAAHAGNGLYVYDMTNPNQPITLGVLSGYLDQGYNHSGWITPDGSHYVVAEETYGSNLKMVDATNVAEMAVVNLFKSTLEAPAHVNSIPHNAFVLGNYCYVSYYHDGVQVFDISDPTDVVRIAYYDTYPDNTDYTGFLGTWGVYPYLPSGRIIASDVLNGLFILDLDELAILPVAWSHFTARRSNNGVRLEWATQAERDNLGFWIQRRTEIGAFRDVFFVAAQDSAVLERTYSAIDAAAPGGALYYRLRQVDVDGTEQLSAIVSVSPLEVSDEGWRVFPNRVQAGALLYLTGPTEDIAVVSLVNMEGKEVLTQLTFMNQLPVPSGITPGTYYLRLVTQEGQETMLPVIIF